MKLLAQMIMITLLFYTAWNSYHDEDDDDGEQFKYVILSIFVTVGILFMGVFFP